jgi:hypothetical protein
MSDMKNVIALARASSKPPLVTPLRVEFRTTIDAPERCALDELERPLNLTLPPSIVALWHNASSLRLFEDVTFGQSGLILLPPNGALKATEFQCRTRASEMRRGDLVVGEFRGDSDLLLVRCDNKSDDFGRVIVELPIYRREQWLTVGNDLEEFLQEYIRRLGRKYWSP